MMNLRWVLVLILFGLVTEFHAQTLKVASYNMRTKNRQDSLNGNGWERRVPVISQLIQFHDFDVFGAQEVSPDQLKDLLTLLPGYNYVGVGSKDGVKAGGYIPVFYKKNDFSVLQSGHFWLSETDDRPSYGWGTDYIRMCTWVQFQWHTTGKVFWVFDTHMDHTSSEARLESVKLVLRKIQNLCHGDPVIFMGDFNASQSSGPYKYLKAEKGFRDTYSDADMRYSENGTYNQFDPAKYEKDRVDHIFLTGKFHVLRYGVLTDSYWVDGKQRVPSDHYPVVVELE